VKTSLFFSALKGRHLNSLGFKPQARAATLGVAPSGLKLIFGGPVTWGSRPRLFKCRPFGAEDGVDRVRVRDGDREVGA
jgi:hypothetical protein